MTIQEWLRNNLRSKFSSQGEDGIVVWYDQGGTLSSIVDEVVPEGVKLIKFEGSYLALRFELEKLSPNLCGKWLIYIPEKPLDESWIRDYELLGERLELDFLALLQECCNLAVTSNLIDLLRNRPENSKLLVQIGFLSKEIQSITENEIINHLLAIVFGLQYMDFKEMILKFICEENWQEKLSSYGLWDFWVNKLQQYFNFGQTKASIEETELRKKLTATILLSELISYIPSLSDKFTFIPSEPNKRRELCEIARTWRDRTKWINIYCKLAEEIEQLYNLPNIVNLERNLEDAETFKFIDNLLIQEIRQSIKDDGSNFYEKREILEKLAEKRKKLFWAKHDGNLKNFWGALELSAKILKKYDEVINTIKRLSKVDDYIKAYTDDWWKLDLWALQLANLQINLSNEDKLRFVIPALSIYQKYLDSVNRAFLKAVKNEKWIPTQWIFWENIQQQIREKERVAIFFIDALRFDLAKELQEKLKDILSFEIQPLKTLLPSITEICITALLPEGKEIIIDCKDKEIIVTIHGELVNSRDKRKKWLEKIVKKSSKVISLNELRSIDLTQVKILIIYSQELDEYGSFVSDFHPKGLFEIVDRISQAVKFLIDIGFSKIFIVSDHGFIYVPEGCNPWTIQAPSEAMLVKKRFAIGAQSTGCWIVNAEEIGLKGRLLFAFPEGFSVFSIPGEIGTFLHGGLSLQECIIPFLKGKIPLISFKVSVTMNVPEVITSRVLKLEIKAQPNTLYDQPRKVKVIVNQKESNIIEVRNDDPVKETSITWLDVFDSPPEFIVIQLLDADTQQVLEEKKVKVKLLM